MTFEQMLSERDARNRDNVSRTTSYLELYAFARERGIELPWVLMAHLVSRNAGYLMTDLGVALREPDNVFTEDATFTLHIAGADSLGPFAGRVWRIGCMGHTARLRNVTLVLRALEEVLSL